MRFKTILSYCALINLLEKIFQQLLTNIIPAVDSAAK